MAQKNVISKRFPEWISRRVDSQSKKECEFFNLCAKGDLDGLKALIETDSYLLHCKSPEGWSGLIVSSFWQRYDVVSFLLQLGANPNDVGFNGTTVIMYAKTAILKNSSSDFRLLELLIDAGANLEQRDNFDKNIFDYLSVDVETELKLRDYFYSKLRVTKLK